MIEQPRQEAAVSIRLLLAVPAALLFFGLYGRFLWAPADTIPAELFFDFIAYFYPIGDAASQTMLDGDLPLWNPYIHSGVPLMASIETQAFYPPKLLLLFLPIERAFNLLLVFHALLGGVGTWLYCKGRGRSDGGALFTAMAVCGMGRLVLHTYGGHPTLVYSAFWWPVILWRLDQCINRKTFTNACGLALVLACQFLAGYPFFTLLNAYLIPVYLLIFGLERPLWGADNRRFVLVCGFAATAALGLVAIQLLPTWELVRESQRSKLTYEWVSAGFPPENLWTLLVPDLFGDARSVPYWGVTSIWECSAYGGILTVFLALASALKWRDREFLFWSITGLLLLGTSLGQNSPLFDITYRYLPGMGMFRGATKLLIYSGFAFAVLAGKGFDLITGDRAGISPRGLRAACWLGAGISAIGAGFALLDRLTGTQAPEAWADFVQAVRAGGRFHLLETLPTPLDAFYNASWQAMINSLLLSSAMLLLTSAGVILSFRWKSVRAVLPVLLLGILAFDLFQFGRKYLQTSDVKPYRMPAARVKTLTSDDPTLWRFSGLSAEPPLMNQFLYERIPTAEGHEVFVPDRYSEFIEIATGLPPQMQTYLTLPYHDVAFDMLNVKYFAVASQFQSAEILKRDELISERAFTYGGVAFDLYKNPDALPRVMIDHAPIFVESREAARAKMIEFLDSGKAPEHAVIEARRDDVLASRTAAEIEVEKLSVVHYSPNQVEIDVELKDPAALVLADSFFPGWEATVDGEAVEILPANLWMRSVPVPAGKHRVAFEYCPASFRIGLGISAATALFLIVFYGWNRLRRLKMARETPTAVSTAS